MCCARAEGERSAELKGEPKAMPREHSNNRKRRVRNLTAIGRVLYQAAAKGGIVLFIIMALEVMIMISPFAFFFYSVFNPVFHWLGRHTATRWLTDFFLPHMILPPTLLLQGIRVMGSVLFVVGCLAFAVCALQVYLGKIFKWGIAGKGLYRYVRHPQYLSLGLWGVGMSILWPRFIVLATLSIMFILYYSLARDEEKRMLSQHGHSYARYKESRGMFFPRAIESRLAGLLPRPMLHPVAAALALIAVVIGVGFLCREITVRSLPVASRKNVTLLPILPESRVLSARVLDGILKNRWAGRADYLEDSKDYLGYVMPPDYIMQGMIADTGGDTHLFKQHHTVSLIGDWVLHPFEHLRRPPSAQMARMHNADPAVARRHHCPIGIDDPSLDCDSCPYRRVILVEIAHPGQTRASGKAVFGLGSEHVPAAAVDIDTRTGDIVNAIKVGRASAWKDVPTPPF
jgi:protein-S-isoprenylcysteine O-methyltransferase Ste14